MSNNWEWEQVDNSEYRLKDIYGQIVAYLTRSNDNQWVCRFYNDQFNFKFCMIFLGLKNNKEAVWQATLWIYDTCKTVMNSFQYIQDNLPECIR